MVCRSEADFGPYLSLMSGVGVIEIDITEQRQDNDRPTGENIPLESIKRSPTDDAGIMHDDASVL